MVFDNVKWIPMSWVKFKRVMNIPNVDIPYDIFHCNICGNSTLYPSQDETKVVCCENRLTLVGNKS